MPKRVDHGARRREIAAAVARIARDRGLQGVSFREVAAEAGMSVSLVQHYFGSKENLLTGTLDIQSAVMGERILRRLGELGPDPRPLDRLRTVARAFLPTDDESTAAMLLYHGFAAAALTDESLRSAAAFRNARNLLDFMAGQLALAQESGELADGIVPEVAASALLALVLGLSLTVLLDQALPSDAEAVLDAHLTCLGREGSRTTT